MNGLELIERVVAVLCLTHIILNIALAVRSIAESARRKEKWERTIGFTTISALVLSVAVVVRWVI